MLKESKYEDAERTIKNELQRQPNHPDLLLAQARCIIQSPTPDFNSARKILKLAHDKNQKKEMLFDFWYKCETELDSIAGQIEVSKLALDRDYKTSKWNINLSTGLMSRASLRSNMDKINDLIEASMLLSLAIKSKELNPQENQDAIIKSYILHDSIVDISTKLNAFTYLDTFSHIITIIKHGDIRTVLFYNAQQCILKSERGIASVKHRNAIERCKKELNTQIKKCKNSNLNEFMFDV